MCSVKLQRQKKLNLLQQHKLDVHGESDYKCEKCARVFSLKKTFERHMMDAHLEGEEKYLCDSCVLTFHSPEELDQHINSKYLSNATVKQ